MRARRPNIVYLNSHDTGRWIGPYGHAVATPRLQGLAEEGVLFRRAFAASPTCSPSRAALLTGRFPHEVGMLGLSHRGFSLTDPRAHLSHHLHDSGYRTVLAGLQHVAEDPAVLGYDEILPVDGHAAAEVAPAAAAFLGGERSRAGGQPGETTTAEHDEPFYLEVGFFETHRPYPEPSAEDDPRYLAPPPTVPDAPETREDMAGFAASVRRFDAGVGQVLDALDRAGLAESTLVIATTDHGLAFPGMKCTLGDDGLGVMLLMRGPGFRGGAVCDALVSQLDLLPTICEATGTAPPADLRGRPLQALMEAGAAPLHEEIFAELTYHVDYQPQRCVRTERYAYIRSFRPLDHRILEHTDAGASKQYLVDHGWGDQAPGPEELYDLVLDPRQSYDRAGDPACAAVLADLRSRLDDWMRETDDPLLHGPVPAPAGANVRGAP